MRFPWFMFRPSEQREGSAEVWLLGGETSDVDAIRHDVSHERATHDMRQTDQCEDS